MGKLITLLALATAVALTLVATTGAAPPTSVTITVDTEFGYVGTFTTTGGILCPSGTTSDVVSGNGFQGGVGNFHDQKTFACDDGSGTFTLHIEAHVFLGDPTDSGSWSVSDGTGAYAGLQGSGTLVGTYYPDFSGIQDELVGRVLR
jgi:hypothetical protein